MQLGAIGETAVKLQLEKFGWGTVTVPREHDLGQDLFALVRDDRRFDLNLMLVAQVKTGDRYFRSRRKDATGQVDGWWFADTKRKHVDNWLAHVLPHIVVLHNHHEEISYWALVTPESVESTGKGAKVFVPKRNVLDLAHRDELVKVAASVRSAPLWEGSAWSDPTRIPPRDLLRHAVLVPRLVAPHRNAGSSAFLAVEQVVALLVEARSYEIDRHSQATPGFEKLEDALDSSDWMWRFIGALYKRVSTGAVETLVAVVADGPTEETRAAAAVVAAASLIELARVEEAIVLLEKILAKDKSRPVDHAWLRVQHARAKFEIGAVDEARSSAVRALAVGREHAHDLTATAIAGSAAAVLFSGDVWELDALGQVISSLDNTASWWRTQRQSAGATAVIEREFTTWAQDRSIVFRATDEPNDRLFAASLLASYVGDQGAWRALAGLTAKQAFIQTGRHSAEQDIGYLLNELRLSGDHKELQRAVQRLVGDGPSAAVTMCASEIDLADWTRTTVRANLALLRYGGDVLAPDTTRSALRWLLDTLDDPGELIARTRPSHNVAHELIDTLSGVVGGAEPSECLVVAEKFLTQPPIVDELDVRSWTRLIRALPDQTWDTHLIGSLVESTEQHDAQLRLFALGVAAQRGDTTAEEQLLRQIRNGSMQALVDFGSVRRLPADDAELVAERLEEQVHKVVTKARLGSRSRFGWDYGNALAVLNVNCPAAARWESIYSLLEEPGVAPDAKSSVCSVLVQSSDSVPADVRSRLIAIAETMRDHPVSALDRVAQTPDRVGPAAALALSTGLGQENAANLVIRALTADQKDRAWLPMMTLGLPLPVACGVLAVLAHDADRSVRASAASVAVQLFADRHDDEYLRQIVRSCASDPGVSVRFAIAQGLNRGTRDDAMIREVLETLSADASARVRSAATAPKA